MNDGQLRPVLARQKALAGHKAPMGELIDIMDVGYACAYLPTPFARRVTGGLVYVDGGANLIV